MANFQFTVPTRNSLFAAQGICRKGVITSAHYAQSPTLVSAGFEDVRAARGDVLSVGAFAEEITDCVAQGLAWVRDASWEAVAHDELGLAVLD